jgi:DNA-binding response OmpR family regulator
MKPTTLTVLLIEDDPDYASLVQHWLSAPSDGINFVLNWTDSLEAGKARLERGGVDAVLLDLGLPDSTGMATFLGVRQTNPGVPVIILSAGDDESLALEAIQQGAQDYLVKNA